MKLELARAYYQQGPGHLELGIQPLEEALLISERHGVLDVLGRALIAKSNILMSDGRRREGVGLLGVAYDIGRANDLADVTLRAGGNLASNMTETDLAASLQLHDELLAQARRIGRRESVYSLSANLAYSQFLAGEWDANSDLTGPLLADEMPDRDRIVMLGNASLVPANRGEDIEAMLAQMRQLAEGNAERANLFTSDPVANAALARGDLSTASSAFLSIAIDDPSQLTEFGYRAARPLIWSRDVDAAKDLLEKAEERGSSTPFASAAYATMKGGIAALEGRTAEALGSYREALRGFRGIHARWDEALTGLDMAQLLDTNDPEVAEVIKSTRAILTELRAKPYLDRLEAAASGQVAEPQSEASAASEVAVGG